MLPTPSTSHVSFDTIYEPSEDSFLFLDTFSSSSETTWLRPHFPSSSPTPLIAEIGTGSGVVLAFLAAHAEFIFGREDVLCLGVDVNPNACRAAAETVKKAIHESESDRSLGSNSEEPQNGGASKGQKGQGKGLGCICSNLTSSLRNQSVDVLVFNPPYVPTDSVPSHPSPTREVDIRDKFEQDSALLSLSYAGGTDGMEITDKLLDQLPDVLSQRGVAYILFCRQNRPEEVKKRIRAWKAENGWVWAAETVGESGKRAGWEKLEIVRIWRQGMSDQKDQE